MKIVFVGAGVIGGSVGAWVSEHNPETWFLDQGPVAEKLRSDGITTYHAEFPDQRKTVKVNVIDDLNEVSAPELVVLGVKNYSLDGVAAMIKEKLGDGPIIMSMANGIDNQRILPKYFSKIVYCVVSYNGWLDETGVIGYQKKGPLIIGTPDNSLMEQMKEIREVFDQGVETIVTEHLQDAVHCKIAVNLINSVTTLLGPDFKKAEDRKLLQKVLSGSILEGTEIIKAAGHKECKLGGMPSWKKSWAATKLPRFMTGPVFEKAVRSLVISSMAQDVATRGGAMTEVDSITGYILELADKTGHKAPINRTAYDLCKEKLGKPDFKPLSLEEFWEEVKKRM